MLAKVTVSEQLAIDHRQRALTAGSDPFKLISHCSLFIIHYSIYLYKN
jgi:hypothetical protein